MWAASCILADSWNIIQIQITLHQNIKKGTILSLFILQSLLYLLADFMCSGSKGLEKPFLSVQ